jgi:PTS system nitrogen regulatory IIA component
MINETDIAPVICLIDQSEKNQAIEQVISRCSIFDTLNDKKQFAEKVIKRELKGTTGIGHGIAIAHGKVESLNQMVIGLGVSVNGVDYQSVDSTLVNFLFVIASSSNRSYEYLKSLAIILRNLKIESLKKELFDFITNKKDPYELSTKGEAFLKMMVSQHFSPFLERFI